MRGERGGGREVFYYLFFSLSFHLFGFTVLCGFTSL